MGEAWQIDPQGVQAVLSSLVLPVQALQTGIEPLSQAIGDGVMATSSVPISNAVQYFFDSNAGVVALEDIFRRISAAAAGVKESTEAYIAGDETMAAHTAHEAIAAVNPVVLPRGVV